MEESKICDFKNALKAKIKSVTDIWQDENIYAISFLVYSNECNEYYGFLNVVNFAISYNTETKIQNRMTMLRAV